MGQRARCRFRVSLTTSSTISYLPCRAEAASDVRWRWTGAADSNPPYRWYRLKPRMPRPRSPLDKNVGKNVKTRTMPASPQWQSLRGEFDDLAASVEGFPSSTQVPEGVASLLETSRSLFLHSWFQYSFGPVAVAWSFVAIEAGIRDRLRELGIDAPSGLHSLGATAIRHECLSEDWSEHLDAGRRLRNKLAHGEMTGSMSPGAVESALATSHALVIELFPDGNA